ncbi:MAG TPA: hypothetical protein VLG50_08655 [Candidatus Saccharimonadales bacterium]|nr:hypothetical protein [Candidatus Saccharimonadales bacterium]
MKHFIYGVIFLLINSYQYAVIFQGLKENSNVTKNTFSCPTAASGASDCSNADSNASGFVVTQQSPLQFFNNQSYWLRREAEKRQDYQTNQPLSGTELDSKMQSEGWVAMGSYCILISTNSVLTDVVMPNVTASGDQVKVVVQLWYNGENNIQLWSQDAAVMSATQGFSVLISSDQDDQISQLPVLSASSSKLTQNSKLSDGKAFLNQIGLQINNRTNQYGKANNSPRSVKIQLA